MLSWTMIPQRSIISRLTAITLELLSSRPSVFAAFTLKLLPINFNSTHLLHKNSLDFRLLMYFYSYICKQVWTFKLILRKELLELEGKEKLTLSKFFTIGVCAILRNGKTASSRKGLSGGAVRVTCSLIPRLQGSSGSSLPSLPQLRAAWLELQIPQVSVGRVLQYATANRRRHRSTRRMQRPMN